MKFLVILALVAAATANTDVYSKYPDLNVDEITSNERLMNNYCNCWLKQGPCTTEASDLRSVIPDAMESSCGKCSEHQKELVAKVCQRFMENVPECWNKLNALYNPGDKYTETFNAFLAKYGKKN